MFKYTNETGAMMGDFQEWNDSHTDMFIGLMDKFDQVVLLVKYTDDRDLMIADVQEMVADALEPRGFFRNQHYVFVKVPDVKELEIL